jgi:hypothetical protein
MRSAEYGEGKISFGKPKRGQYLVDLDLDGRKISELILKKYFVICSSINGAFSVTQTIQRQMK